VAHEEQTQDLDARRTIITKKIRSRSKTIKYLSPVTDFAVTSFDKKKEKLAPPHLLRGFLFAACQALLHNARTSQNRITRCPDLRKCDLVCGAHHRKLV
jgi:hypothetical protein